MLDTWFRSRLGSMFRYGERQAEYRKMSAALLADLAEFCRANESTFNSDALVMARLEGRRDVWRRIQEHIHLSDRELIRLYAGQPLQQHEDV